jgi:large subunit ribosomal protein L4
MKYKLYNQKGEELKQIDLPVDVFEKKANFDLMHQSVVAQMARARHAIAHTKDRSEVRGGGKKPWKQKGTGRARHGSIRSPLWIGGGVTFGPTRQRNFFKKINKKMKHNALFMALSLRVKENEMIVLDKMEISEPKTKILNSLLKNLGQKLEKNLEQNTLIVLDKNEKNLILASKNLPKSKILKADSLNVLDVLRHKYLIITESAIEIIEKFYKI